MNIASKNQYCFLVDENDQETEPPPKPVEKPTHRKGRRFVSEARVDSGREGASGIRNEEATDNRDDECQTRNWAANDAGEFPRRERRGGRIGRGGRGGRGYDRGRGTRDDRHSHSGFQDSEKQVTHAWEGGAGGDYANNSGENWDGKSNNKNTGEDWYNKNASGNTREETTGESYGERQPAAAEENAETPENQPEKETTKSYAAWLAEQAEKKAQLGGQPEARQANEGGSNTILEGSPLQRDGDDEVYIQGSGAKAKPGRRRKEKPLIALDDKRFYMQPRESFGRGRGGGRGRRGDRDRGDRDRGGRGNYETYRHTHESFSPTETQSFTPDLHDQAAFPSLGA